MSSLPSFTHRHHLRFGPAAIARLTKGIRIAPDGTITAGQHRLLALLQLATSYIPPAFPVSAGPTPQNFMPRKQTCPYCQTVYRSVCCPLCREERLRMQSTDQPDWTELEEMRLAEKMMSENGDLPHYAYDYGIEESF